MHVSLCVTFFSFQRQRRCHCYKGRANQTDFSVSWTLSKVHLRGTLYPKRDNTRVCFILDPKAATKPANMMFVHLMHVRLLSPGPQIRARPGPLARWSYYQGLAVATLQQGLVVEDLMLYGWGLTNDTSVKFTSSSGEFGANCKTNDSKLGSIFSFWIFSLLNT